MKIVFVDIGNEQTLIRDNYTTARLSIPKLGAKIFPRTFKLTQRPVNSVIML